MTLKKLNQEIAATYGSIVSTIEELLLFMNELGGERREINENAKQIVRFLRKFKTSVESEESIAQMTPRKNESLLISLKELLEAITDLQTMVQLALKGNREARVIRGINVSHKLILKELDEQKRMITKAA